MFKKNEFKAEIVRRGITIKQVAKMLGIGTPALYNKLRGQSDFSRKELEALISILELSNDEAMRMFFGR